MTTTTTKQTRKTSIDHAVNSETPATYNAGVISTSGDDFTIGSLDFIIGSLLLRHVNAGTLTESQCDDVVAAAKVILKQRQGRRLEDCDPMTSSSVVREHLQEVFFDERLREKFVVMYLDCQHQHIATETMFVGTVNAAPVYPREIARRAIELGSTAVILAHNHPSGNTEPSEADKRVTKRIQDALFTLDIKTLDHLIVDPSGHNRALSFAERGLM